MMDIHEPLPQIADFPPPDQLTPRKALSAEFLNFTTGSIYTGNGDSLSVRMTIRAGCVAGRVVLKLLKMYLQIRFE